MRANDRGFASARGLHQAAGVYCRISCAVLLVLAAGCEIGVDGLDVSPSATTDAGMADVGPTFPALPSDLDEGTIARAGALLSSCLPYGSLNAQMLDFYFGLEAYAPFGHPFEAAGCLSRATDGCAALERCTGLRFDVGGPCSTRCDGTRLTACDNVYRFSIDCADFEMACDASKNACVSDMACDIGTFSSSCVDGAPVVCGDREPRTGLVCSDYGLACSRAACRGTGGECSYGALWSTDRLTQLGVECVDAQTLRTCVNGGLHDIRCADRRPGFACQTVDRDAFCGVASECRPRDVERTATCDGNELVFCNAGGWARVDCTSLGFTECKTNNGQGEGLGAYCAPASFNP